MYKRSKGYDYKLDYTKRSEQGLLWWVFKRFNKLNRMKNNEYDITKYNRSLLNVLTFKECEIIYQLPKGTCQRDYDNGKMKSRSVRKSYSTYLITVKESVRLYENYWTERANKNEKHLHISFDGQKLSEHEYFILTLTNEDDEE